MTEAVMDPGTRRRIRLLEGHAIVSTSLLIVVALGAFSRPERRERFEVIDVERINVIEKDGTLRVTISNRARMPDPVIGGKSYPLRGGIGQGSAGLIFFNNEGNEAGGLAYAGADTGSGYFSSGLLTFDQFNQNEALSLSYTGRNGRHSAGLAIADQPEGSIQPVAESLMVIRALPDGPAKQERMRQLQEWQSRRGAGARRVYLGKQGDKSASLVLADPRGRTRARIMVDSLGAARLEFLDENGRVMHRVPEAGR
jgi:hypothetical protein